MIFQHALMVQDFLENSADRTPDKEALIYGAQRLTYTQVDALANRFANYLRANGISRGDRVILYLPNTVELVAGIFGVLKAGGVFVVVNHTTKQDKLLYMANNCRAGAIVARGRDAGMMQQLMAAAPSLNFAVLTERKSVEAAAAHKNMAAWETIVADCPASRPSRLGIDRDLACLIYTSGSTGEPKGVMSAHHNVAFAASSIIHYLQNVPEDIVMVVSPLSFDYGLYQLLMVFKFGGTLVLEKGFTYPVQILQLMQKEKVTGFPGVPTVFALLLQMDLTAYDLSSLRYITNTAAALPPSHIARIGEIFPWATMYSMYGLTETKRTLYLPPDQIKKRPGSVGIAIPGTEVWLEDENGNRLGPDEVGELVVRGGHVMMGYWERPEATAQRYRPGPLPGERVCYSGDLFRMDEEGYLYFVGRKDDIIKSRGEKVAPKEVENVLYSLPGVTEVAVIGIPDPVLGQAIKAILVAPGGGLTEKEVLAHCKAHLEDFMVPQFVEFRKELPKTSSGKIKKTDLA